MSVSKNFLEQLDKLIVLSDDACECDRQGSCPSCQAKEKVEHICMEIDSFLSSVGSY
jgi:hypothetical protein